MTVLYVDVVQEQVTAANVAVYTAPTATNFESAHITFGNCTNVAAANSELTLNIVQVTASAATTNQYFPAKVIFPGRTDPLSPIIGKVLKAGDFISSIASVASSLNLSFTIKEIYTDT